MNAGSAHAGKNYWILGAITTSPGIVFSGVTIPLNPDFYTDVTMSLANSSVYKDFKGVLGAYGCAEASLNIPATTALSSPATVHHAYIVYDSTGKIVLASNPVSITLK